MACQHDVCQLGSEQSFFSFSFFFFQGSSHSGKSKVTRVTVGRDTKQSFRVCKVNLATLKVATHFHATVPWRFHFCRDQPKSAPLKFNVLSVDEGSLHTQLFSSQRSTWCTLNSGCLVSLFVTMQLESSTTFSTCRQSQSMFSTCRQSQSMFSTCRQSQSMFSTCRQSQSMFSTCRQSQSMFSTCRQSQSMSRPLVNLNRCSRPVVNLNRCSRPLVNLNRCSRPVVNLNRCSRPLVNLNRCSRPVVNLNRCCRPVVSVAAGPPAQVSCATLNAKLERPPAMRQPALLMQSCIFL